jgi:hypothetical protein
MVQNVLVAASSRAPEKRNLKLKGVEVILSSKVMDGLMDLDVTYEGFGHVMRDEFFPGKLREKEIARWNGDTEPYDTDRKLSIARRGRPRLYLPKYANSATGGSVKEQKSSNFSRRGTPKQQPGKSRLSTVQGQPDPTITRGDAFIPIDNMERVPHAG